MEILKDIRQYKNAYADFLDWLQSDKSDIKDVEAFLKLPDKLAWGTLIGFLHSKDCNILLGQHTVSIVGGNYSNLFKAYFDHKGMKFIFFYSEENKIPFTKGLKIGILNFFKELDLQLDALWN